ncbi:MAG: cache domain-containing protein [Sulfuricurvum sp.]|uniref:cache domain-containing protein n=1 Tax=Sulfuricurvum sp. TaxID=2025608 RepID=UPI0026080FCB|nr:cache domain-containing protein [Sulfuricurvum sp.]MDD2368985.1 cache domain-containing protein [Sulfuricurvum sp.]MDD2950626.1 cache domain-containing protein [Sulfuricurvum sp.]MDD5118271.1 cache domain-containing protein [Sulfuricurvum sp.]
MDRWVKLFANKKTIAAVFLVIMMILGIVLWQLEKKVTSQTLERLSDQLTLALNNQLEKERSVALRYALILSQNTALSDALKNDDEDKGFKILSEGMESIKVNTDALIRSQVITSDYVIFARSWDNSYAGMPLDFNRPDLLYFQTHRNPRSAIEVGRKLGVKATVPIYYQDKINGFVEVVSFFESTQDYFDRLGINLYILMDSRFYDTAVFMQENPGIGKKYILANAKYTQSDLKLLSGIDFNVFKHNRVIFSGGRYLFYEPMKNGEGETIGAFVFSLSPKQIKTYAHSDEEDISFLIHLSRNELYDVMVKKSLDNALFQSVYDKDLLYLKDTVAPEDRELFLQEAHDRLNAYSKEELIGIMLDYKVNKKIKGEIR